MAEVAPTDPRKAPRSGEAPGPGPGSGPAPAPERAEGVDADPDRSPVADVLADLGELKTWARHLLTAKLDTIKLKARHLAFLGLLIVVALVTGAALMVTGAVLLLQGLAEGAGVWLGSVWLGKVLVAGVFFIGLIVTVVLVRNAVIRTFDRHLQRKYDALHARHRIHHGHDVEERAHERAREEQHGS